VIGNKLYLQGGGWDRLTVNSAFPVAKTIGLAASFVVPWNDTNQASNMELDVLTADGKSVAKIQGQFKVGRPADIPRGQEQRTQVAGNVPLKLEAAGTYEIVARLEGEEQARIHFNVVEGPR
jgi:hypothetical protein